MLNTSIQGFKKAGIVISEQQQKDLAILNMAMTRDMQKGNAGDPVFYMSVLLRIMGVLPKNAICETEYPFGEYINQDGATQ